MQGHTNYIPKYILEEEEYVKEDLLFRNLIGLPRWIKAFAHLQYNIATVAFK